MRNEEGKGPGQLRHWLRCSGIKWWFDKCTFSLPPLFPKSYFQVCSLTFTLRVKGSLWSTVVPKAYLSIRLQPALPFFQFAIVVFGYRGLSFLCFFFLLDLHQRHMAVPRLGVEWELQLPAYTTAHGNGGHFNALSEARDLTHILMDTSWVLNLPSHDGNSQMHILSVDSFSKRSTKPEQLVFKRQNSHTLILETSSCS